MKPKPRGVISASTIDPVLNRLGLNKGDIPNFQSSCVAAP
jgi:hypothetical protein